MSLGGIEVRWTLQLYSVHTVQGGSGPNGTVEMASGKSAEEGVSIGNVLGGVIKLYPNHL